MDRISDDETLQTLQERGYRITGPRRAVLEAAQEWDGSFTADEIHQHLDSSSSPVGRATVFRTLDLLVQQGILDRLHRPDGCHSYVVSIGHDRHHHHLICSSCGTVRDVTVPAALERSIERNLGDVASEEGFAIDHHRLDLIGRCAAAVAHENRFVTLPRGLEAEIVVDATVGQHDVTPVCFIFEHRRCVGIEVCWFQLE